jgi:hypothetical protein
MSPRSLLLASTACTAGPIRPRKDGVDHPIPRVRARIVRCAAVPPARALDGCRAVRRAYRAAAASAR